MFIGFVFLFIEIPILADMHLELAGKLQQQEEENGTHQQGRSQEFLFGGPSATLIHLLRQLPHTCIYTYARFFIIYTHFLFDKLYIYTQKKGV